MFTNSKQDSKCEMEKKEETEKVEKEECKKEVKPASTIKWGKNTLANGLTTTSFKSSGLFGVSNDLKEKKETTPKKEPVTLKWGSGKTSLLERNTVQSSLLQKSGSESEETKKENEKDDSKEDTEKEDIVFQMRVKVYLLEDNKYNPRGKGNLKIIRFKDENETKYQIVLRREGEEGGLGTVLVFNSLLYKSTPIKEMGDDFLLITLPTSEGKLNSFLFKPVTESVQQLKQGIENVISSL